MKCISTHLVSVRLGTGLTALAVATLLSVKSLAANVETASSEQRRAAQKVFEAADELYESGRYDEAAQRREELAFAAGETRPADPKPIVKPTPEKPPKLRMVQAPPPTAAPQPQRHATQTAGSSAT